MQTWRSRSSQHATVQGESGPGSSSRKYCSQVPGWLSPAENNQPIQWTWVWANEMVKDREAWLVAVHGAAKSWTWLSDWTELNPREARCLEGWQTWSDYSQSCSVLHRRCAGRGTRARKPMSAATIDPGLSCWRLWMAEVTISDFVKATFKFFHFLNLQKPHYFQGPCQ